MIRLLFRCVSLLADLLALSRGPGAVVRRQARKTLHKAVDRRIR